MDEKPKMTFRKDPNRGKKPKPVKETPISAPKSTFDVTKMTADNSKDSSRETKQPETSKATRRVGRPKNGRKQYQTIRVTKETAWKLNALQNALAYPTQEALIDSALERVERSMTEDEKRLFALWHDTLEKRWKRK